MNSSGSYASLVNGSPFVRDGYAEYHQTRIARTLAKLGEMQARNIVEVGGHPWAMTSALVDAGGFKVCATISAEEVTKWPDDINPSALEYRLVTNKGNAATFINYSANVERRLFDIDAKPDTVIACEIVEHLVRAPHVLGLNINRWLPVGGQLLLTTPNGAAFMNPLRRRSQTAAYRCYSYERHSFMFAMHELVDLIELCGFEIVEAGYWNVYERRGATVVYAALSGLPLPYFRQKFSEVLYVVAKKVRPTQYLSRLPLCYEASSDWEYIGEPSVPELR
jgi:hypothetical protein